jgi:DNA-binding CsgD family transcriptional regulator
MNTSCAYIIYRSGTKAAKTQLFFNDESKSILFPPVPEQGKTSLPEISSLCSKWKEILDRRQDEINGSADGESSENKWKGYIDIFQSWRRRYTVRGILLSEQTRISKRKGKSYLFIIERFKPENLNLTEVFRHWNLNHREQEIVRLILRDFGNKEIAKHLGISINTVKAYMKLLLRKVGVHTRAGVISTLLTGKEEE